MKLTLAALAVCAGSMALVAAVAAADYVIPRPRLRSDDTAMTLCGRNLAEAHSLFCYQAGYYKVNKKSASGAFPPPLLAGMLARYEDRLALLGENEVEPGQPGPGAGEWPWLGARRAGAFDLAVDRSKRGIVEECCYKPCTRDELLTYC